MSTEIHDHPLPVAGGGPVSGTGADTAEWTVGVVAQTITGEVVLKMTESQADDLRESLIWLTGGDE